MTTTSSSNCYTSFNHWDFDLQQLPRCPVRGCTSDLIKTPFTWRRREYQLPYCREHGLRLHGLSNKTGQTFVYYNGRDDDHNARLRNIRFESSFVRKWVLDSSSKAETHRLGYELSEDALSWNVFVSLLKAGSLSKAMCWLAGRQIDGAPDLYLWGCHVDLEGDSCGQFPLLKNARTVIEPDVRRFQTEPDVMLVVPNRFLMCIEAKFISGNPLAVIAGNSAPGEKPKDRRGLLDRYLFQNTYWKRGARYICPERIGQKFHSQLFRNVVFAAGMAEQFGGDWQVVNLVRSSGNVFDRHAANVDYDDPTEAVRCYLTEGYRDRFTMRTWEGLYRALVKGNSELEELANYFGGKSAFFRPAFNL